MFVILLLFIGAQAITYDEMKEYNCYTPRNRINIRDLRCGLAVDEHKQCEEMCRTIDTIAKRDSSPANSYKGLLDTGEQLCEITFSGRCASRMFRNEEDLCFTINTKPRGYNEAIKDCEDNGGHLYVPNSDNDLRRLLTLIDSRISRFWFGGGSIFFRTCRDPSMGKNEEVAVQYMITDYDDRYLGYATTRITSEKAPYICAAPRGQRDRNCLSFNKPTPAAPTVPPPEPPRCSFKWTSVGNGMMMWDACFPDGPLRIGDTVVIEGVQSSCCPAIAGNYGGFSMWSINLFSATKSNLLHFILKRTWQTIEFTAAPSGWGYFIQGTSQPNPFLPNQPFRVEITNTPKNLAFVVNGRSYTYGHVTQANPDGLYHSIGLVCQIEDFKITSVGVRRNGIRKEIGIQELKFYPALYPGK